MKDRWEEVLSTVGVWPADIDEVEFDLGVIQAVQRVKNRKSKEIRLQIAAYKPGRRSRQLHWSMPDFEARHLLELLNDIYGKTSAK